MSNRTMIQRLCAFILYRVMGWRLVGEIPWKTDRLMLVFLPHTSNWDFVVGMLLIKAEQIKLTLYGKDAFYFFPFTYCYRYLGVVPIQRNKSNNFVTQAAGVFRQDERRWVAMAPEGTRSHRSQLKSGYYYLAREANLPIFMVGPNFEDKTITLLKPRELFETFEQDAENLIAFSRKMKGKKPKLSV